MHKTLTLIKNILIRILVLTVIFVLAVAGFYKWNNQTAPSTAQVMADATFPLVYMQNGGVSYNCLHGYAREVDVSYVRESVTVLPSDHKLDIQIQPFDTNIESVSFEVLTLDGSESLENTNVVRLAEDGEYINAALEIGNNMLLEQEYILKLQVTAGGRDIYFYTRLFLEDGLHLDSYLDFVTGFYAKCINKTDQSALGTVVEPDDTTGTSVTLAEMDIHDTVAQLMWGDLNPEIYYKPAPTLVDINGTTASFVLDYQISAVNEEGVTEIYNVKEFYRLRYTDMRVYLLDFTRSTEEVFNTDKTVLTPDGINLGITSADVEYAYDDSRKVVAFVQENELWSYIINGGKLTRVFGFSQQENMDYRDFYDKNEIKILRVDSSGDIWFAVSGYMNRGKREGENGIGIFCFEEASSTVEEVLFVRTAAMYDTLSLDINSLSYITQDEQAFYVLLEGIIYRIDLNTLEYERVVEGIRNDCYASSESNQYFCWLKEGERYSSRTLCVIDFETEEVREIRCGEDESIRPVCFMGEDLVYGKAYRSDIELEDEGNEVFPMYRIVISDEEGTEKKTYEPSGIYVMSAKLTNHVLVLSRAVYADGEYTETTEDRIVSTDNEDAVEYGIATSVDSIKQTEILLRVGVGITDSEPQVVTARILTDESSETVEIPANRDREELYYVYAGGALDSYWTTASEAIRRADESVGVVINNEKEFVWERGNQKDESIIRVDKIPDVVKTGTMDIDALEEGLGKKVISLTGCTLEQVLYFVSQGRPVLAATPDGVVIITGYDDYGNLILLNPGETDTYYYGPNDSVALFESAGNRFVTYLETAIE